MSRVVLAPGRLATCVRVSAVCLLSERNFVSVLCKLKKGPRVFSAALSRSCVPYICVLFGCLCTRLYALLYFSLYADRWAALYAPPPKSQSPNCEAKVLNTGTGVHATRPGPRTAAQQMYVSAYYSDDSIGIALSTKGNTSSCSHRHRHSTDAHPRRLTRRPRTAVCTSHEPAMQHVHVRHASHNAIH